MTENELILAFSNIVDIKIKDNLNPIKNDISKMQNNITNMQNDIKYIQNELYVLKVDLLENNVIPRLDNIEKHYVSASDRYINSIEL